MSRSTPRHESAPERDLGPVSSGRLRYLHAEAAGFAGVGAVLAGGFGWKIGSEIESHAAYLGHWIEMLKAEPTVLFQVLRGEARAGSGSESIRGAWGGGAERLSEPHRK